MQAAQPCLCRMKISTIYQFSANSRQGFRVFTYGWQGDVTETEFRGLLQQLKIFPAAVLRLQLEGWKETGFFLQFDRMRDVKLVMSRLQLLRRRWRLHPHAVFFALPRRVRV
ncbi:hypothetical protein, conserved [Eimeria necatrix]|uniref:RRM domain-containing protein n=1 Tax=Eimeria necatrix TaxID=51315 RepID=U6N0E3_9EIME|nr:hypothetical protein, conserved [Eimeria necatrix]CDJ68773.1 hypothetical protein, conserved [Eimeria necatrix]